MIIRKLHVEQMCISSVARSPRRFNFVQGRLIFVGSQCAAYNFEVVPRFLDKLCTPDTDYGLLGYHVVCFGTRISTLQTSLLSLLSSSSGTLITSYQTKRRYILYESATDRHRLYVWSSFIRFGSCKFIIRYGVTQ